jgi:hypothetical protein
MNEFGSPSTASSTNPPGRRVKLLVYGVAFLMVLVPFLFWQGTWFGRKLSDKEMAEYLSLSAKPRNTQHALLQITEKLTRGQKLEVQKWYPQVLALIHHPVPEVRVTLAWSLGQDNLEPSFRDSLQVLLKDSDTLVRRNAALSLVRFGDGSGRGELLGMLRPVPLVSPRGGVLKFRLKEDDSVNTGTLIARIHFGDSEPYEFRSPLPGFLESKIVEDGKKVSEGDQVVLLSPTENEVWEALRALYLVGEPPDIPDIEPFAGRAPHMAERTRQQARLTIEAIRRRSSPA